ncbi:MAG: hypothetical protein Q9167_006657 [Letrouitia subvulpina]
MEDIVNTLSSEDLQLLEAYRSSLDAVALQGASHSGSVHGIPSRAQHEQPSSLEKAASGYSTFPVATGQGRKRQRAKFEDPRRRAEVAQCSSTRPYFSREDLDIIQQSCFVLMEEHTELQFSEVIQWDINALSTDFSTWMITDDVHPVATSRVGIFSRADCQDLLRSYLSDDLCINFRLLVKISSLIYNGNESPHPYFDRERLILMRSLVGTRLLKSLEATLKSSILTKASREQLTGLFMVLLGVIIAVSYTVTISTEEARCGLSRLLAHHMVVIGERIGLLDCDVKKQQIVGDCRNLWNKTGHFEWNYRNSSVVEGMDMDAFTNQGQNCQELSLAASLLPDSPLDFIRDENNIDHQLGDIIGVATTSNYSHQEGSICNTKPQSAADPQPDFDWLNSCSANWISSPTVGETTICFDYNGSFPSDEMYPTCFGPLPEIDGCSNAHTQKQVLQEFTDLLVKGNVDHDPVVSRSEITHFYDLFHSVLESSNATPQDIVSKLLIPSSYHLARPVNLDIKLFGKIIGYHATYPFPSEVSTRLDPDALLRAFTLLSGKDSYIFGGEWLGREVLTRRKTESDGRKLLFRSLAIPVETSEEQTRIPENDGRTDALDDALDVLSCIQPRLSACRAPLARSDLQLTAARLFDPQVDIQSLRIRRGDLHHLCMLLLAFHSAGTVEDSKDKSDHMLEFAKVADWMVQSFCVDGDGSDIKWETFDTVIEHTMPYLWTGFTQVLRSLFSSEWSNTNPLLILPTPSTTQYFLFPYQISTFLPRFVHNFLHQAVKLLSVSLYPEHAHNDFLRQLIDRWNEHPKPSIILISAIPVGQEPQWESGPENAECQPQIAIRSTAPQAPSELTAQERNTTESESVQSPMKTHTPPFNPFMRSPKNLLLFGAFIATAFFSDTSTDPDAGKLLTRSQLFQLAPLHDVFPCRKAQEQPSSWRAFQDAQVGRDGGLRFGAPLGELEPGGVSLSVDENFEFGEFVHKVDGKGVFNPSVALGKQRGNERIKFKVIGIEAVVLERKAKQD